MEQWTRRGQFHPIALATVGVVGLAGAIGMIWNSGGGANGNDNMADTFTVRRGSFDITIPVTGELAAMDQIEIRNMLDKQAVITEIVPEGSWVNEGDVLLRLNDEEIRNKLRDSVDEVNTAEASVVEAETELDITYKERDSELDKAELAVQLAELALKAWQEGEDVSRREKLQLSLETAEKEFLRLEARFKESKGLLENKFISLDEYRRDEIAMIQARAELKQAERDIEVYGKYEYVEKKKKKESDLEQAQGELERAGQRYEAKVRRARTELESKKHQLESKQARLKQFEEQLSYCAVTAPSPGLVVYYSSLQVNGWGRGEDPPQVGSQVWPNQAVIVLPDTSKMVAAVKVSEALSGLIQQGQKATVISDAHPEIPLSGEVISVGVLAQSGGWRDPNRRDYTVRIALNNGSNLGLKPSMRCKAEIFIDRVEDVLHIPVQGIFRTGPVSYVYVPDRSGYAQQLVTAGRSSELYIEIADGMNVGDMVLVREPEPSEVVATLETPNKNETVLANFEGGDKAQYKKERTGISSQKPKERVAASAETDPATETSDDSG